eukprot:353839-Chlamydomonas_euryale.AAC.17
METLQPHQQLPQQPAGLLGIRQQQDALTLLETRIEAVDQVAQYMDSKHTSSSLTFEEYEIILRALVEGGSMGNGGYAAGSDVINVDALLRDQVPHHAVHNMGRGQAWPNIRHRMRLGVGAGVIGSSKVPLLLTGSRRKSCRQAGRSLQTSDELHKLRDAYNRREQKAYHHVEGASKHAAALAAMQERRNNARREFEVRADCVHVSMGCHHGKAWQKQRPL